MSKKAIIKKLKNDIKRHVKDAYSVGGQSNAFDWVNAYNTNHI